MMRNVTVKQLTTLEDMKAVQELEWRVWKMEPIPYH